MADNTDLLNQFRQIVREENAPLKEDIKAVKETQQEQGKAIARLETGQQEQGKVQQEQGKKLDRVEDGQNRQHTTMKVLQGTIEETKAEVDKLLRRPRQAD